ncbi:hypothetical protein PanWU01x14_245070, partial [Parasponia andersonii]
GYVDRSVPAIAYWNQANTKRFMKQAKRVGGGYDHAQVHVDMSKWIEDQQPVSSPAIAVME